MAVPRNRTSDSRKGNRRSHHARKPKNLATCDNCNSPKLRHVACPSCGQYAGRQMLKANAE